MFGLIWLNAAGTVGPAPHSAQAAETLGATVTLSLPYFDSDRHIQHARRKSDSINLPVSGVKSSGRQFEHCDISNVPVIGVYSLGRLQEAFMHCTRHEFYYASQALDIYGRPNLPVSSINSKRKQLDH